MSLRRGIGILVVFLMLSGNLPGSDQQELLQVRWSELKTLIGGKRVTLQLAGGARLEGRIGTVNPASLAFNVTKSSNLKDYPKGRVRIPRETVSRIEVRGLKGNKGKRIAATAGTFVGTMMGSMVAIAGTEAGEPGDKYYGSYAASIAISTAVAILVNRALRPKDITLIRILPDSPGAGVPTPTHRDENSKRTPLGKALPHSFYKESSSEQFRRHARRAVMRKDLPLDLPRLPVSVNPVIQQRPLYSH